MAEDHSEIVGDTASGLDKISRLLAPIGYDGGALLVADPAEFDPLPLVVAVLDATSASAAASSATPGLPIVEHFLPTRLGRACMKVARWSTSL